MPFWTYSQNNTGGSFDYDPNRGISNYVIVEAENADAADERAREIGLYFDGAGDCPCCSSSRVSLRWRGRLVVTSANQRWMRWQKSQTNGTGGWATMPDTVIRYEGLRGRYKVTYPHLPCGGCLDASASAKLRVIFSKLRQTKVYCDVDDHGEHRVFVETDPEHPGWTRQEGDPRPPRLGDR